MIDNIDIDYAISLLSEQFQDSDSFVNLIKGLLSPLPNLKDTLIALKEDRAIDTAFGKQLDRIGEILNVSRNGRDDSLYRSAILAEIFIATSNATPNFIVNAIEFLTESDVIIYQEIYPAGFQIFLTGSNALDLSDFPLITGLLELDDGTNLELSDGTLLKFETKEGVGQQLIEIVSRIRPAGISNIILNLSLGRPTTEMFGFNSGFLQGNLVLDDGATLTANDDPLALTLAEGDVSGPYFFAGFGAMLPVSFVLDDGSLLELDDGDTLAVFDSETVTGGGKLALGQVDYGL